MVSYYYCSICGNLIETIHDSGNTPSCCGKSMKRLNPASTDGAVEKHVPVCSMDGNVLKVDVGSLPHPMDSSHYIEWIAVCTNKGYYRKHLSPGDLPMANFVLEDREKVENVYAHCNLHGLWIDN